MDAIHFGDARRGIRVGISHEDVGRCLDNVYPTFQEALESMGEGNNPFRKHRKTSIAFSKCWAVGRDGSLLYKGDVVGGCKDKPLLEDKYIWLAENLQGVLDDQG